HTVGPVWQGGGAGEDELLASAWRNSLQVAADKGLQSIAFPSISTGAYRFPLERAAGIAIGATAAFLAENSLPERVTVVCYGDDAHAAYLTALREMD
ncbi:MAG TPA: macro domain-containing protein, partial [Longimicrobium sp.]|nr:macro domain-containing protein [Longimicrobium sp.]